MLIIMMPTPLMSVIGVKAVDKTCENVLISMMTDPYAHDAILGR